MNGNNPYAGLPGVTGAGERAVADQQPISPAQCRTLYRDVSLIADRTRALLPEQFLVDASVNRGPTGLQVTVAVRPPVGHPVSAGFTPDLETTTEEIIAADDRSEVARGLAASAALQVKQAMNGQIEPTAR